MSPEVVNTIGLALNIAGVCIAFFYGYPQPSHEESVGRALEDGTVFPDGTSVAQLKAQARKQKARYLMLSRIGLGFMTLGFVVQLVATWIARPA